MTGATIGSATDEGRLPAWLWLWIPLVLLASPFLAGYAAPDFYQRVFKTEFGVIDNLTVLVLIVAAVFAGWACHRAYRGGFRPRSYWLLGVAVAIVFYLGEELSWGQHFIGWTTPEGIFTARSHSETNLHNIHPAISRAMHAVAVTTIVLVGGILTLTPAGRLLARRLPGSEAFWLWALPIKACSLTAILTLAVKLPKRSLRWTGNEAHWPGVNDNELIEVFVAYFLLLYAVLLWQRTRTWVQPQDRGSDSSAFFRRDPSRIEQR